MNGRCNLFFLVLFITFVTAQIDDPFQSMPSGSTPTMIQSNSRRIAHVRARRARRRKRRSQELSAIPQTQIEADQPGRDQALGRGQNGSPMIARIEEPVAASPTIQPPTVTTPPRIVSAPATSVQASEASVTTPSRTVSAPATSVEAPSVSTTIKEAQPEDEMANAPEDERPISEENQTEESGTTYYVFAGLTGLLCVLVLCLIIYNRRHQHPERSSSPSLPIVEVTALPEASVLSTIPERSETTIPVLKEASAPDWELATSPVEEKNQEDYLYVDYFVDEN